MRVAILLALTLTGCAAKKVAGPSIVIEPGCVTKPIVVANCDLKTEPPHCAGPSVIPYRKGCETVKSN